MVVSNDQLQRSHIYNKDDDDNLAYIKELGVVKWEKMFIAKSRFSASRGQCFFGF